jgi:hypothetical protein
MARGTRFERGAQEAAWQSAEVDALHRLFSAGVRVPGPRNFFGRFEPGLPTTDDDHEIWDLCERGLLTTQVSLTGRLDGDLGEVSIDGVMREIGDALAEQSARRLRMAAE